MANEEHLAILRQGLRLGIGGGYIFIHQCSWSTSPHWIPHSGSKKHQRKRNKGTRLLGAYTSWSFHCILALLRTNGTLTQHFCRCVFWQIRFVQMREVPILALFADSVRVMLCCMVKRAKITATP